ncbi:MAG: hypothetical protein QF790_10100 [Gammaproteobacteria bacterium]|nr:hypothetical protein [Gammaproteobacteria bacterium]MDP6617503.1 hypothetical protein [Gammaproteobacteria bacterium]MDP6695936.1 hypothetical protein [Gammaproteobacteria bacterium]
MSELQSLLSRIYGIEINANVADYIVTDKSFLKQLLGDSAETVKETLLIVEEEDFVDLALYLDQAILDRLSAENPCDGLSHSNLDDFCKVLEGISHFVYVAWNAGKDKCITRLELEMQAEVDKYISSRFLLESRQLHNTSMLAALFEHISYDSRLQPDALERYRRANDVARRYCHTLEQRFPVTEPGRESEMAMLYELRAFYRMPQPEKLSHINTTQFA